MGFESTEEHRQLADSVARLLSAADLQRSANPAQSRRLDLWPELATIGALGASFSEAHGGFAGDARTMAVLMFEFGQSLLLAPYLATAVICGRLLQHWTDPTASEFIDRIIAGNSICVLAHETATDPFARQSLLNTDREATVPLIGRIRCIRHADAAANFIVPVNAGGSLGLYLVPRDAPGLSLESYRLLDGTYAADLILDKMNLHQHSRLQLAVSAAEAFDDAIEMGVLGVAAETAGIQAALNRDTFSYLTTRKQFGVALAAFQALQHRAADMYIAAQETQAAVNAAILAFERGPSLRRSRAVSAAKVVADVAGRKIGHEAIQLHGGMGVSNDLRISHFARRLATIRAELGSVDMHRLRFARLCKTYV